MINGRMSGRKRHIIDFRLLQGLDFAGFNRWCCRRSTRLRTWCSMGTPPRPDRSTSLPLVLSRPTRTDTRTDMRIATDMRKHTTTAVKNKPPSTPATTRIFRFRTTMCGGSLGCTRPKSSVCGRWWTLLLGSGLDSRSRCCPNSRSWGVRRSS